MAVKAVQQIMLGSVTGTEAKARETLRAIKAAGYDGIELNGFMIKPTPFMVQMLTKAAGMPTGKGGKLDWKTMVSDSGLKVVSVHEDLGSIERDTDAIIEEAKQYATNKVVITGMYRFDYTDADEVKSLCQRMNKAGETLAKAGISLLYHNHNVEFHKLKGMTLNDTVSSNNDGTVDYLDTCAYGLIMNETDPNYVNFEMDSYWMADAGVSAINVMKRLGDRLKLYHINDRGTRLDGPAMTPITKCDSMELGYGNMDLNSLVDQALSVNVDAIILESHKNWIDKDPVKSLTVSAEYMNGHVK